MRTPLFTFLAIALPQIVFGASVSTPTDFKSLVNLFISILDKFVVAIFALTFLVFIWGIIKAWIIHVDDPKEVENGKNIVFVTIIALVIMSSIWGIVALLQSVFI